MISILYRQSNSCTIIKLLCYLCRAHSFSLSPENSLASLSAMLHKSRHAIKTVDVPYWHTRSEDGVVLPAFLDQDSVAEIRRRKVQEEDIFVASFPKSGSLFRSSPLLAKQGSYLQCSQCHRV